MNVLYKITEDIRVNQNTSRISPMLLLYLNLKVHKIFCENMALKSEQIMEKTQKFQIVYAAHTNLCKQTN